MALGVNKILGSTGSRLARYGERLLYRLTGSELPTTVRIQGMELNFPEGGYFPREIAQGEYEPRTTRHLLDLLQAGMTVVDVGAHVGYYSLLAGRMVGPSGKVFAFEPDPLTFSFLKRNVEVNGLTTIVHCENVAVAEQPGEATLFIGRRDRVANSLIPDGAVNQDTVKCAVVTLDDFFEGKGWPVVDIVKIDVEGAELSVLRGMTGLSRRNPLLKLIIEFFPANLTKAGVQPTLFFDALQENGFSQLFVISETLEQFSIPEDLPALLRKAGPAFLNLLCAKAPGPA